MKPYGRVTESTLDPYLVRNSVSMSSRNMKAVRFEKDCSVNIR